MSKIFKYDLEITDMQTLGLPKKAQILTVQFQGDKLCLWALVNPENSIEQRIFILVGTGHIINAKDLSYIGTVQHHVGKLVWHVFEEIS